MTFGERMEAVRTAPPGQYRLLGIGKVEIPGEGHWVVGDFDDRERALQVARGRQRIAAPYADSEEIATVYYVYDDQARFVGEGKDTAGQE